VSDTPENNSRFSDQVMMLRPAWNPGEVSLTDLDQVRTILEENRTVKGIIRAKGACPIKHGEHVQRRFGRSRSTPGFYTMFL
jgi:hypothetical protein